MDEKGFDGLAKGVARAGSRRNALRAGLGAAAAGALAAIGVGGKEAEGRKKRCRPKGILEPCTSTGQCCRSKTGRICASTGCNGFPLQSCCRPQGARCSADCDCCGTNTVCELGFCITI
jgi:hypothetical protein